MNKGALPVSPITKCSEISRFLYNIEDLPAPSRSTKKPIIIISLAFYHLNHQKAFLFITFYRGFILMNKGAPPVSPITKFSKNILFFYIIKDLLALSRPNKKRNIFYF